MEAFTFNTTELILLSATGVLLIIQLIYYLGLYNRIHTRNLVDEQIVFSALHIQMGRESLDFEEQLLPVGQIASDAHIRFTCQGKSQIAERGEKRVERCPLVQPAFPRS